MKFSDITPDESGRPYFIRTEDYKFNRRHRLTFDGDKKIFIRNVPLELENLLYALGFKENSKNNSPGARGFLMGGFSILTLSDNLSSRI